MIIVMMKTMIMIMITIVSAKKKTNRQDWDLCSVVEHSRMLKNLSSIPSTTENKSQTLNCTVIQCYGE
jgi:hypothetical protein